MSILRSIVTVASCATLLLTTTPATSATAASTHASVPSSGTIHIKLPRKDLSGVPLSKRCLRYTRTDGFYLKDCIEQMYSSDYDDFMNDHIAVSPYARYTITCYTPLDITTPCEAIDATLTATFGSDRKVVSYHCGTSKYGGCDRRGHTSYYYQTLWTKNSSAFFTTTYESPMSRTALHEIVRWRGEEIDLIRKGRHFDFKINF